MTTDLVQLTDEGRAVLVKGSPEARMFASIPDEGIAPADLTAILGKVDFKAGNSQCMKAKWIRLDKAAKKIFKQADSITDACKESLMPMKDGSIELSAVPADVLKNLKRRKMVAQV